jgi:sortase (surface protein transpeptidase)
MNFGQAIFIAHKLVGNHPNVLELGEMSMELAIWLEAELSRTRLKESGDQDALTGLNNFLGQPQIRAIVERSENAAERGYTPQLRDEYGNMTQDGRIKAELVSEIIQEVNEFRENYAYTPMSWIGADEIIINATIPVRSLKMLQMLSRGTAEAEDIHRNGRLAQTVQQQQRLLELENSENSDKAENAEESENSNQQQDSDKKPYIGVVSIRDTRANVATPNQEFQPQIYNGAQGAQAYVPTSTFGQKARTDLRYLIRYGLVELKAYVTGRGRPKHIIRVSTPGERILLDLQHRNLL